MTPEVDGLLATLGYELARFPDPEQDWVGSELRYVRRAAHREAERAYDAWRRHPRAETYIAYRAAQDRADAAQDHLAHWLSIAAGG